MSKIDLHIHTNVSLDGDYEVEDILKMAKENQLETISITDHNSVTSVTEAILLSKKYQIRVIPGIEIDCIFQNVSFHMTAYNINIHDSRWKEIEKYYNDNNINATRIGTKRFLETYQIYLNENQLNEIAIHNIIVPEDLAHYLLTHDEFNDLAILKPYRKGGNRSDNPNVNFYWDYFSQGKIGYVDKKILSAEDVIEYIHESGGIAVIAHPGANFKNHEHVLIDLLDKVDGIEVFSTYHSNEQINHYFDLAKKYKLLITCGSDFHGHHKPAIKIGKIPGKDIEKYISL